jgi:hypothetical protein
MLIPQSVIRLGGTSLTGQSRTHGTAVEVYPTYILRNWKYEEIVPPTQINSKS